MFLSVNGTAQSYGVRLSAESEDDQPAQAINMSNCVSALFGWRSSVTWVWLTPAQVDFGLPQPGEDADERTIWLHANPYAVLGLPPFADDGAIRRAYRQLARLYHPDLSAGTAEDGERFRAVQHALETINGDLMIAVEPDAGTWWRFVAFSEPGQLRREEFAVIGLTFEITDPSRVPLASASDGVHVLCANQRIPLTVSYSGSRLAPFVVLARLGSLAESAVLTVVCLALLPIIAALLALDVFVVSDENMLLTWGIALVILVAGYGAIAGVFIAAGKPVPDPRRAVFRARGAFATVRALSRSRT
jgi:hypothetical protein